MTHAPSQPAYQQPTNGLGIAAFVLSLVGWFSCGLLSPVAFIMGLVAMKRDPKGFAIAGMIIGALGSLWLILIGIGIIVFGAVGVAAIAAGIVGMSDLHQKLELERAESAIATEYYVNSGRLPTQSEAQALMTQEGIDLETLPRYTILDPHSFELRLPGEDGVFDTGDDIVESWTVTDDGLIDPNGSSTPDTVIE